jgi:putative flippase GtrA
MTEESVLPAPPRAPKNEPPPWALTKFAIVGGSGAVLNTAVFFILHQWRHAPLLTASAVAVELAVISNYLLNDRWIFGARSRSIRRFAKFNLSSLGGVAVNVLSIVLLTRFGMHFVVANLVGIAAGFIANFALSSTWVWTTA